MYSADMRDLVVVAGARPNFIKIAPIMRALETSEGRFRTSLIHTGQHYDAEMSKVFFRQLDVRDPDEDLDVGSGSHGEQTARVMTRFEKYLLARSSSPAGIVVVGDVNSTMACTLVAAKLAIPVAHVEAGLRSHDRRMPEEINRIVTDSIADLLLVSEPDGLRNLQREGIPNDKVEYVGNVMIDTLVRELGRARQCEMPEQLGVKRGQFALVTLHRPSNVDDANRLTNFVRFVVSLAQRVTVVFPVHPRTAAQLSKLKLDSALRHAGVTLLEPLGYWENLSLMDAAQLVISDSGGIQEETTYLRVPCVTLRENTERPVTITRGTNTIVGHDVDLLTKTIDEILAGKGKQGQPIEGWDGCAAERIATVLQKAWAE